jgi:hypothetical protein
MEAIKSEIDDIIDPKHSAPLPRPIHARECACGCDHSFYPRRRDNIYLNKQHADFAYNHGVRKAKNRNRIKMEKILRKNDNVLDKHYKSEKGQGENERFYDILKADGFMSGYSIGRVVCNGIQYQVTYRYIYRLAKRNEVLKIYIKKT